MSDPKHGKFFNGVATGLVIAALIMILCAVFVPRADAGERWIVVGDGSWLTVSGSPIVTDPDQAWPAELQRKSRHQIIPLNRGNTAFLFNGADLFVQIEAAKALEPDGIIIAAGVLDWATSQPLITVLARVSSAVTAAKATGKKVVCLTPHYRTDWQTRRMPFSAKGRPLFTVPSNPGVAGFAQLMGAYCAGAGANVITGQSAAIGLANVGPLTQFTRTVMLPAGHDAMALHVYQQLVNQGLMTVVTGP